jgi:hypothetical protein
MFNACFSVIVHDTQGVVGLSPRFTMPGWLQLIPYVSLRTFLIFGGNSVKPSCHPKTSPSDLLLNDGTRRLKVGSA